jgi:histidyl-tRNA synthetase
MDHEGRSMKKQMKQADKNRARYVLILGDDELAKKEAILKNMASGEQVGVTLADENEEFAETMRSTIS